MKRNRWDKLHSFTVEERHAYDIERFYKRVKKLPGRNACHVWQKRGETVKAYGQFVYQGSIYLAHRAAWELDGRQIPVGMCILHKCDNPPCVRLSHLFVGTKKDNAKDMVAKGRRYSTIGENNPNARLTGEQVAIIRKRHAEGFTNRKILAKEYGCSVSAIDFILARRSWAHV